MPQPFSQFHRGQHPSFELGPGAIAKQPALAVGIAQAIGIWAFVEQELGSLLVKMLGGEARPAMTMFAALTSTAAQNAAINAVAQETMTPALFRRFGAVKRVVSTSASIRNKLVHHVWGYSPQVPDGLLLADPKYLTDLHFQMTRLREMTQAEVMATLLEGDPSNVLSAIAGDTSKIFVYRLSDFNSIIDQFAETAQIVTAFSELLVTPKMRNAVMGLADASSQRRLYRKLFRLPRYREALRRTRDKNKGKAPLE